MGAELLGQSPAEDLPVTAPDLTLPPAADPITDGVATTPSRLVERVGLQLLAAPVPLAAAAGVVCLVLGGLVLVWRRR